MRRIISIVTVCIFILVTFSGCGLLQKMGLQSGSEDELRPVSSIVIGEDEAKKLTDKVPIHLYFANEDNTKLKLEVRYIPLTDAKQGTSHLASVIVRELIKGPSADTGYKSTIPAGTTLRTPVSISSRIATVDMSKEFKSKHPGGKDAEKMTIYSIVNSLTELADIEKVKFTIAGKVEKEYMGSFQFNAPFPRSTSLISKEAENKSSGIEPEDGSAETSGEEVGSSVDGLEILE
jgi:germination protein M